MKINHEPFLQSKAWSGSSGPARTFVLALAIALTGTVGLRAAENAVAEKMLAEAKVKETHTQELRAAAETALQKAADDQMEAGAEERDARILTARALSLLGADDKKQKAFNIRHEARKMWAEAHRKLIEARNAEQRAAQQTHNAEELTKAAAQLKDQPTIASTLENEAKEQTAEAQHNTQTTSQDRSDAKNLLQHASAGWAAAEKLDPDGRPLVPTGANPPVSERRQVK